MTMTSLDAQTAIVETDLHEDLICETIENNSSMLDGWTDANTEAFQSEILTFRHRLEETGKFTDEALVDLGYLQSHN